MRSLFLLPLFLGFSEPAFADSETFKIDVSAESYRNYILSGSDRNGSLRGMIPQLLLIREIQLFLMSMHLVIPST